jgi:protein-tyrosine phosphatase
MDTSSYFIQGKALFGGFPSQEKVEELEALGVRYFVNLTQSHERLITPYHTKYTQINFPIPDRDIPTNMERFKEFIAEVATIIFNLDKTERLYLHCKAGHGRSGVAVASLLCHIFNLSATDALRYTTLYHSQRPVMREKWRAIGSPQTKKQKDFVHAFALTQGLAQAM